MEVKALFEILAAYLGFVIDFVLSRGMERYARLNALSPQLVSYFVAGVFIAYLIAKARRFPGYEGFGETQTLPEKPTEANTPEIEATGAVASNENKNVTAAPAPAQDAPDMAAFVLMCFGGALLFHAWLYIYSNAIFHAKLGSVKDTLNAVFAYNAVYFPLDAAIRKARNWLQTSVASLSRGCAIVAMLLLFLLVLPYLAILYYLDYALAAVHGTTLAYMFVASITFLPAIGLPWLGLMRLSGLSLRDLVGRKRA